MSKKQFFNNLSSVLADIRKLDAKEINLKGKNILDYISDSEFDSYDTRDPQLKNDELDIWNTAISLSDNNHIEVKPFEHTYEEMTDEQKELLFNNAAQIINNEVLDSNGNHLMYWQTDGLTCSYYYKDEDNDGYEDADVSVFCYYSRTDEISLTNKSLTVFDSDLSNLTDGYLTFFGCNNLTTFNSDLSSLTNGSYMFGCCENLTTFNCNNLSNLEDGTSMFDYCPLTSFSSDLSSLTNGYYMFSECKLDAKSFIIIIHTLPQREEMPNEEEQGSGIGFITIGVGIDDTEEDQLLFLKECDYDAPEELLNEFSAKNWIVDFQLNGRPTSTYNMRRGETRGKTLPIYAKLIEVIMPTNEKERKPHYTYTSQDGTKFYNIRHFHSTNGSTEGYDVFSSLEEAIAAYNVIPKN